ncbi:MAG: hypothetical protein RLZZ602_206, partial [Pseudomonadota bacterium]
SGTSVKFSCSRKFYFSFYDLDEQKKFPQKLGLGIQSDKHSYYNWVEIGSSVLFLISVTATCECSSRIAGLTVSVLRTNSS